jgi:hypothetical protein
MARGNCLLVLAEPVLLPWYAIRLAGKKSTIYCCFFLFAADMSIENTSLVGYN